MASQKQCHQTANYLGQSDEPKRHTATSRLREGRRDVASRTLVSEFTGSRPQSGRLRTQEDGGGLFDNSRVVMVVSQDHNREQFHVSIHLIITIRADSDRPERMIQRRTLWISQVC